MDTIRNALIDTEKSIVKLFNSGDVKGILAYFNTDFVGFSSTRHERLTGLSQLKKTFLHYLDEGEAVKYSINGLKVTIYGESALTTFYWKVSIRKGKKETVIDGRGSHVFLMTEGGWSIVHEHYSKAH